jgi:hypothetical protein
MVAGTLVGWGALAAICIVLGLTGIRQLVTAGTVAVMLAPLGALGTVAFAALRARDRLAAYAIGAILVTGVGILIALQG